MKACAKPELLKGMKEQIACAMGRPCVSTRLMDRLALEIRQQKKVKKVKCLQEIADRAADTASY